MAIVTLTTDLGLFDSYVGSVKGAILKNCPDTTLIDISNQIAPFDTFHAAFVIKNAYPDFPSNTIHLINVESESYSSLINQENGSFNNYRFLLVIQDGQFFLGRDNGIFSLIFDKLPELIFELPVAEPKKVLFPARDVLAKFACRLAQGNNPENLGKPVKNIQTLKVLQPQISGNTVRGNVIYIDRYENVLVNINKILFESLRGEGRFSIMFKRNELIDQLRFNYGDVPEGEKLAFFNASGYLEIAINKGKAASLLGLKLGDIIQIDFQ